MPAPGGHASHSSASATGPVTHDDAADDGWPLLWTHSSGRTSTTCNANSSATATTWIHELPLQWCTPGPTTSLQFLRVQVTSTSTSLPMRLKVPSKHAAVTISDGREGTKKLDNSQARHMFSAVLSGKGAVTSMITCSCFGERTVTHCERKGTSARSYRHIVLHKKRNNQCFFVVSCQVIRVIYSFL